jgi:septum formation protein
MGEPNPVRLILASSSPARRELLSRTGLAFEVMPAHIDEPTGGFADPRTFVQTVSWLKAAAVAPRIDAGTLAEGTKPVLGRVPAAATTLVLAADTIAWIDGQPILKPQDEADARRILRQLGGREHELWTGVVLWRRPDDLQVIWQEQSRVFFTPLTDPQLDAYLATREWQNNSGAYAIQEQDDPYVRVVSGSVTNVIGLPLESLTHTLSWLIPTPPRLPGALG